ncbi:MAG: hypothetical protein PVI96_01430, partial [Desulfobacterales bacterium]
TLERNLQFLRKLPNVSKTLNLQQIHVKPKFFLGQPAIGIIVDPKWCLALSGAWLFCCLAKNLLHRHNRAGRV